MKLSAVTALLAAALLVPLGGCAVAVAPGNVQPQYSGGYVQDDNVACEQLDEGGGSACLGPDGQWYMADVPPSGFIAGGGGIFYYHRSGVHFRGDRIPDRFRQQVVLRWQSHVREGGLLRAQKMGVRLEPAGARRIQGGFVPRPSGERVFFRPPAPGMFQQRQLVVPQTRVVRPVQRRQDCKPHCL